MDTRIEKRTIWEEPDGTPSLVQNIELQSIGYTTAAKDWSAWFRFIYFDGTTQTVRLMGSHLEMHFPKQAMLFKKSKLMSEKLNIYLTMLAEQMWHEEKNFKSKDSIPEPPAPPPIRILREGGN